MYQRIVVPLDGSELAEAALPHALYMARLTNAPLHVVRVVDTSIAGRDAYGMAAGYMPSVDMFDVDRQAAADYLETMPPRIAEDGITVTSELRAGQVAREIVAATVENDLVVMTSHGRGGVARWFLGSIAEEVTRHSTVPVLLIRISEADLRTQRTEVKAAEQPAT